MSGSLFWACRRVLVCISTTEGAGMERFWTAPRDAAVTLVYKRQTDGSARERSCGLVLCTRRAPSGLSHVQKD